MKSIVTLWALLLSCAVAYSQTGNEKPKHSKVQATPQHLKLYPVEADKYVNIYVSYDEPTDFTLTLPGSNLNNEKTWNVKAKMTYQHSMDVSALPVGSYSIILDNGKVKEKLAFKVKR